MKALRTPETPSDPFAPLAESYDGWYDAPDGRRLFSEEVTGLRDLLEEAPRPWLEVGVGTGRFAEALHIDEGIEPSETMRRLAANRGVTVRTGRAEALPYDSDSFGEVLLVMSLCFLDDPNAALRECRRILRRDGVLIVGIATLSDNLIPFAGEWMLNMPNRGLHLGFIEKWWLVNPLALLGALIAFGRPRTQFPHAGHVLLSTWASLFHMMAAMGGGEIGATTIVLMGTFLFLAVWLPCCTSDIVFPLVAVLAVSGPKARRQWLDATGCELVRSLGVQPGDRVLDFGCNWGAYAIPLAQTVGSGGEVVAVERNPKAIRALRRNLEKRAVRNIRIAEDWAVVRGAAGARPFQAILLFDVLHMMPADGRARLYADVREMLADVGRLAIHPKHTRENQPARHFSSCSEADVQAEIESAGFRLAERREVRLWHGHDQEAGCLLIFAKASVPKTTEADFSPSYDTSKPQSA